MSTCLLTGVAGFLGSHVAEHLKANGHEVIGLDDMSGGFVENVPPNMNYLRGSINDLEVIDHIFRNHKIDYIFHLAAYAAEGLSHFIKRFNYENNLIGSINLINAAVNHGVKCFVFTSSIAVYGDMTPPFNESMIAQPEDSYGISKLAVEHELVASRKIFGLPYIIFRPHNVFGPRQNIGDKYRNVVGIFMNQLLQDKPMTIFGDGEQRRAFSYIDDVAPIIARSIEVPAAINNVFNIGADMPVTVNQLSAMVAHAMGKQSVRVFLRERTETKIAWCNHSKIREVFGCSPQTELLDGITKMAQWVELHGARSTSDFAQIEIRKNLPEGWE